MSDDVKVTEHEDYEVSAEQIFEQGDNAEDSVVVVQAPGNVDDKHNDKDVSENVHLSDAVDSKEESKDAEGEPTAMQRVEARAKFIMDSIGSGAADNNRTPQPESANKQDVPKGMYGKLTKEQIGNFLQSLPDEDIPDGEFIIGNETVNLKQLKEDFPEHWSSIKIASNIVANKALEQAIESGKIYTAESVTKMIEERDSKINSDIKRVENAMLLVNVATQTNHKDVFEIVNDKGFHEWAQKSPKPVQMLYYSPVVEDATLVLDLYKEHIAKGRAQAFDDKQRDAKNKHDDIHKHVTTEKKEIKQDKRGKSYTRDEFESEAEAAFMASL